MGKTGMLEGWRSGMLGKKLWIFLALFHYSNIPLFPSFHYSRGLLWN
jgi:hypothetical protein